jgi:hypothetical protein
LASFAQAASARLHFRCAGFTTDDLDAMKWRHREKKMFRYEIFKMYDRSTRILIFLEDQRSAERFLLDVHFNGVRRGPRAYAVDGSQSNAVGLV